MVSRAGIVGLRDRDIRQLLHDWLTAQHADEGPTTILHEFKIPRPSARADIAVVNGELTGFEIKGELDSLSRLPRQVRSFGCIFDRLTLVTTARHSAKAFDMLPPWWGIVHVVDGHFEAAREAAWNPDQNLECVLYTLERRELLYVIDCLSSTRGLKSATLERLVAVALIVAPSNRIMECVKAVLKMRASTLPFPIDLNHRPA